jgi:hypothetical protein
MAMATSWFQYSGSGSINDPTNYIIIIIIICPSPKRRLCAIFATIQIIGGIQRPIITPALQAEINLALLTLTESANVLLRP